MSLIVGQLVDPNAGLSARADRFAMCTIGAEVGSGQRFYLLDMLGCIRPDTTDQPKIVTEEYRDWAGVCSKRGWPFYAVGIQTIFYETDLFRHLKRENIVPLKEIPRRRGLGTGSQSKFLTLLGLQGRWSRGQIILPGEGGLEIEGGVGDYQGSPWLQGFLEELMEIKFIEGKDQHKWDDQVEVVALCVEMLSALLRGGMAPQEPTYTPVGYGG